MRQNHSSRKKHKRNRRKVNNQRQRNSLLISNSSADFFNFLNQIEIGLHNDHEWARNLFAVTQIQHSSRQRQNGARLARNRASTGRHNVRSHTVSQQLCRHHKSRGCRKEKKTYSCSKLLHSNIQHKAMTKTEVELFRDLMYLENLEKDAKFETNSDQSLSSAKSTPNSSNCSFIEELDNTINYTSSLRLISDPETQSSQEDMSTLIEVSDSRITVFRNESESASADANNAEFNGQDQIEILDDVERFRNMTTGLLESLEFVNANDTITDDAAGGDGFHNDPYFQIEFTLTNEDLDDAAIIQRDENHEETDNNENDNENSESDINIADNYEI